jgi:hypothetical protein
MHFHQWQRREFITLLGAAAAWPLAAGAQTAGKLPTIGLLAPATSAAHGPWFASLVQRLYELGWIEGRTVAIEQRYAEGRSDRYMRSLLSSSGLKSMSSSRRDPPPNKQDELLRSYRLSSRCPAILWAWAWLRVLRDQAAT